MKIILRILNKMSAWKACNFILDKNLVPAGEKAKPTRRRMLEEGEVREGESGERQKRIPNLTSTKLRRNIIGEGGIFFSSDATGIQFFFLPFSLILNLWILLFID